MTEVELRRDKRKLLQHLRDLTKSVETYLAELDVVMAEHESPNRGGRIAKLSNALEIANDSARYFGLGINYRTDKKRREVKA